MLIEVCDRCRTEFGLVDICGENKVLCHHCLKNQYKFADFQLTFDGDLRGFNAFVNMLIQPTNLFAPHKP